MPTRDQTATQIAEDKALKKTITSTDLAAITRWLESIKASETSGVVSTGDSGRFTNESNELSGRKAVSKFVYDFYHGTLQLRHLKDEMMQVWPETWKEKFKQVENITKQIIDEISMVYKQAPSRKVAAKIVDGSSDEPNEALEGEREEIQEQWDSISRTSDLDFSMQKAERYEGFDNTILIQILYVEDKLKVKVYPQFLFDVLTDENGKLIAVALSDYDASQSTDNKTYTVWTEENFWRFDADLTLMPSSNEDNENPYNGIPICLVRTQEPDQGDYCDADLILAQTNQNLNLLLSSMVHVTHFQAHGQLIGLNVEFPKNQKWGIEHMVKFMPKNPEANTQLEFIQPEANIDLILGTINRMLSGLAGSMGLPTNTFSMEKESSESGVALKIRSAPLIARRQSMEAKWRSVERKLTAIMVDVWNTHVEDHGQPTLPDDLSLTVDFTNADEAFESRTDQINNTIMLKAQDLISLTQAVMRIHPSMSEADARKHIENIAKEKQEFGVMLNPIPTGPIPAEAIGVTPEETARAIFEAAVPSVGDSEQQDT